MIKIAANKYGAIYPVFFTATAMIGMIALAGIVMRNSLILIDFIENIYRGNPDISLADAIVQTRRAT